MPPPRRRGISCCRQLWSYVNRLGRPCHPFPGSSGLFVLPVVRVIARTAERPAHPADRSLQRSAALGRRAARVVEPELERGWRRTVGEISWYVWVQGKDGRRAVRGLLMRPESGTSCVRFVSAGVFAQPATRRLFCPAE